MTDDNALINALIGVTDALEALIDPSDPEWPLVANARAVLRDEHDRQDAYDRMLQPWPHQNQ